MTPVYNKHHQHMGWMNITIYHFAGTVMAFGVPLEPVNFDRPMKTINTKLYHMTVGQLLGGHKCFITDHPLEILEELEGWVAK